MGNNKGFGFCNPAAFFLVFVIALIAELNVSWSGPSSTGSTSSFEHVSLFGGVEIPEKAAFSHTIRVSPFGPEEIISSCDINILKTGWFDVVDHDSDPDPLLGVFNNVIDVREDINSVTIKYEINGQALDVTVTPIKKFESVLGAPFTCDDFFADFGLERKGDEGCWARTFSAPLNLDPGSYQLHTQIFYDGDLILDNIKTLIVETCY